MGSNHIWNTSSGKSPLKSHLTVSQRLVGIDPLAVLADEGDQAGVGVGLGDVVLDAVRPDVEVDFAGGAADVAEVGVGHLAGAVHDAAHDGDFHALEVAGLGADALGGGLQIEEGAAAARAGDEFGLRDARPGALEDVVGELWRGCGSASVSMLTRSPRPSQSRLPVRNEASSSFERKLLSPRTAVAVVLRIQSGADEPAADLGGQKMAVPAGEGGELLEQRRLPGAEAADQQDCGFTVSDCGFDRTGRQRRS
jgi:hypothetical protein